MKLENAMVIVADIGDLRVFHVKKSEGIVSGELKTSYALETLEDIAYIDPHKRPGEWMSDQAGNFSSSIASGSSSGEEHNRELEHDRRSLKELASDIDKIVQQEKPKSLLLAFPHESLPKLLDNLSGSTKALIAKSIGSNLVKTEKHRILSHFE
jgi:hypothetical protein